MQGMDTDGWTQALSSLQPIMHTEGASAPSEGPSWGQRVLDRIRGSTKSALRCELTMCKGSYPVHCSLLMNIFPFLTMVLRAPLWSKVHSEQFCSGMLRGAGRQVRDWRGHGWAAATMQSLKATEEQPWKLLPTTLRQSRVLLYRSDPS
jgi:hypothetical protein